MRTSVIIIMICVALVIGAGIWFFSYGCQSDWCLLTENQKINATNSFADCVKRGFPVQEISPRICSAGNKFFLEGPK